VRERESQRLDPSLLSDQIYDLLRQDILRGVYSPGTRLVETELARGFNVSQAPVRDALRKLAEVGLVRQVPRRGTFVEGVTQKAAIDAFHVREALEPLAARELLGHVNDETIASLRREAEKMMVAAERGDVAGLLEADISFHRIVWWKSENELLPRMWPMVEKIWPLLEARLRSDSDPENPYAVGDLQAVAATHEPLIDALEARAPNTPDLFHSHVTRVWSRLEVLVSGELTMGGQVKHHVQDSDTSQSGL